MRRQRLTDTRFRRLALAALALFAAHAAAQSGRTGTYNFNNPIYRVTYPPTEVYPGGSVSSYSFTNPGDRVPTTYVSHYRSFPPPVVLPVTYYEERYYLPPPVAYPQRPRWRWR